MTKHKIKAYDRSEFEAMWTNVTEKFRQCHEEVMKVKIKQTSEHDLGHGKHIAIIWTQHSTAVAN